MSSTLYWSGADRHPRASAVLARCRNEAIVAVQRTYLGEDRNGRRAVLSAAAARRQRGHRLLYRSETRREGITQCYLLSSWFTASPSGPGGWAVNLAARSRKWAQGRS